MIIQDMKQRIVNNSKRAFYFTNNELFFRARHFHFKYCT